VASVYVWESGGGRPQWFGLASVVVGALVGGSISWRATWSLAWRSDIRERRALRVASLGEAVELVLVARKCCATVMKYFENYLRSGTPSAEFPESAPHDQLQTLLLVHATACKKESEAVTAAAGARDRTLLEIS